MQKSGSSKKNVLAGLKRAYDLDQHYCDGKILCSMCTQPHPLAKKAYEMFLGSNLGDSGLFSGSARLEKEVVEQLGVLLHLESAVGAVVSGGTEANLMAMWAAKNLSNISNPEVILPQSAHFSFTKISNLLNLKPVYAELTERHTVDSAEVEKKISRNTIAIVGTAGTTELGVVDPIQTLSEIAVKHNLFLHVDAAFGGLVIPFLEGNQALFDFQLEGVKSITVDPHKMGMAVISAGGILFREQRLLDSLKTETPYLTDTSQCTFVGTRSGASAASAWAVFKALGREGFEKMVKRCMQTTGFLAENLSNAGFKLVVDPALNIVAFRSNAGSKRLVEKLWRRGWFVSYVPRYDCVRVVVMPHVKRRHVSAFVEALSSIESL